MLQEAFRSLASVKLGGGAFKATIYLLIALSVCVTAVCIVLKLWWLILELMILLFALVFYTIKRLFDFSGKHPFAAIMEGGELLRFKEMRQGKKGQEDLHGSPPTIEHEGPQIPEAEAATPDPPPQPGITTAERSTTRQEC
jgi:hypothetical protein